MVSLRVKYKAKILTPLIGARGTPAKNVSCHATEIRFISGPGDFSATAPHWATITG